MRPDNNKKIFKKKIIVAFIFTCLLPIFPQAVAEEDEISYLYNVDMSEFEDGPITEEQKQSLAALSVTTGVEGGNYDVYFENGALVKRSKVALASGKQFPGPDQFSSSYSLTRDGTRKYYEICFASGMHKQIKFALAEPTGNYNSFFVVDCNAGGNFYLEGNSNKETGAAAQVKTFNPGLKAGEKCAIRMLIDTKNDVVSGVWWAKASDGFVYHKVNPFGNIDDPIGYFNYMPVETNNRFNKLIVYGTGSGAFEAGDEAFRIYYIRSWVDMTSRLEAVAEELDNRIETITGNSGVVRDDIVLPEVTENYPDIAIEWSSDEPGIISADGSFTPPSENTAVTLTARLYFADGSYSDTDMSVQYELLAGGTDDEDYIIINDEFIGGGALGRWDISSTGGTVQSKNGMTAEKKEAGTLNMQRYFGSNGFSLGGKVHIETDIEAPVGEVTSYVKDSHSKDIFGVIFANDGGQVLKYTYGGGEYMNTGETPASVAADIDTDTKYIDLYYGGKSVGAPVSMLNDTDSVDSLDIQVSSGKMYLSHLKVSVPDKERLGLIAKQLTWDKLSREPQERVTSADLITETAAGINIEWSSDKPDVIGTDGSVKRAENDENVILSARLYKKEKPEEFLEKTFEVTVPGADYDNKAYLKSVTTEMGGSGIEGVTDGSLSIGFVSGNEKAGNITLDLGEKTSFSKVNIYEQKGENGYTADTYELFVSDDGKVWKSIYSGTGIGEKCVCEFDPVLARYIKLALVKKKTGEPLAITEIEVYFDGTDSVCVEADAKALDPGAPYELKTNIGLPEKGAFGSDITWSSSNEKVLSKSGKLGTQPDTDTVVTLQAEITMGDAKKTKTFTYMVSGKKSADISSGGSGRSGSGGSGGASYKNVSVPSAGTDTVRENALSVMGSDDASQHGFRDTDSVAWAQKAIAELKKRGIIAGTSDGMFEPQRSVTREEFVKMLVCALDGEPQDDNADVPFTDCDKTQWYNKYIAYAYNEGIVRGQSETEFGTGSAILRQDMAVMIVRALESRKVLAQNEAKVFADAGDISDYAKDAVAALGAAGIINGDENGNFDPLAYADRAQTAQMIYALLNV